MGEINTEERLERTGLSNIRYACYNLLKNIRFSGEPVVPRIISERKEDELLGPVFGVEKLEGVDLADFLLDEGIQLKRKLEVLRHVIRQLEQIDEAGYVLFDRHGGNIRVLKWGENEISVRQIDIEDMYDKRADKVYSSDIPSRSSLIETFKKAGINLWVNAVGNISLQGMGAAERSGYSRVSNLLSRHVWDRTESPRGSNLTQLEKGIESAIESLG